MAADILRVCDLRSGLDAKFKILKLSHQIGAAHALSIKSRRNKKLITLNFYSKHVLVMD